MKLKPKKWAVCKSQTISGTGTRPLYSLRPYWDGPLLAGQVAVYDSHAIARIAVLHLARKDREAAEKAC